MENEKNQQETNKPEKANIWKTWLKRFGVGGLIFFTVKGIITSTLIYFLGKNAWAIVKDYVLQWLD